MALLTCHLDKMTPYHTNSAENQWRSAGRIAAFRTRCRTGEVAGGEVAEVARTGVQIGLVLGGGNIFRGVAAAAHKMDRVTGDHMGMLATVINALGVSGCVGAARAFRRGL